jgi:hypothetical protein
MIWGGLTVLLIIYGLLTFAFDLRGQTFIVMLNVLNILSFSIVFIFRKYIEKSVTNVLEQSKDLSISIKYFYEKEIGSILLILFIVVGIAIMYYAVFDVEHYEFIMQEDYLVEYGSALFWLLAAAIVLIQSLILIFRKPNKYQLVINLVLIIFFIICAGEEISWGQRIFHFQTPEFLKIINVQNETTLHNIGSISIFSNGFFLVSLIFFLYIPFLIKKNSSVKNVLYFLHFPIPARFATYVFIASLFVWIFLGLRFGTLGFHPFSFYPENYYSQMDDEFFELFAAYSYFCFSLLNSTKQVTFTNTSKDEA